MITPKNIFVFAFGLLLVFSACSKKAPEPAQDIKPAETAAEAPKAPEQVQEAKPAETAVDNNAPEQAAANAEKQAEAEPEPDKCPPSRLLPEAAGCAFL